MSSPWSAPPAPAPAGPAATPGQGPGPVGDALAATGTAVGLVLLGAPAGLLWAAFAPRVEVVLGADGPGLADPGTSAFVGADLAFGLVVLVAGLLSGVVALLVPLLRPYGPGTVVGLLLGGLLAAYVASRTGQQVDAEAFRSAVRDAQATGTVEASVRLRAVEALVLWPVGALVAHAVGTALRPEVSSG